MINADELIGPFNRGDRSVAFAGILDYLALYAAPMDSCFLGGERLTPQAGGFYGGWITSDIVGPFKGGRGTNGW